MTFYILHNLYDDTVKLYQSRINAINDAFRYCEDECGAVLFPPTLTRPNHSLKKLFPNEMDRLSYCFELSIDDFNDVFTEYFTLTEATPEDWEN